MQTLLLDASTGVARMPVGRRLRTAERLRLLREILAAYGSARRAMRRMTIGAAIQTLRGDTPEDP
ncbi:MAG TPA: hypothetical protein VFJ24_06210, partial [Gaiellales bacterium]|nr:hypothetical protein [Gaiellales bacterium]